MWCLQTAPGGSLHFAPWQAGSLFACRLLSSLKSCGGPKAKINRPLEDRNSANSNFLLCCDRHAAKLRDTCVGDARISDGGYASRLGCLRPPQRKWRPVRTRANPDTTGSEHRAAAPRSKVRASELMLRYQRSKSQTQPHTAIRSPLRLCQTSSMSLRSNSATSAPIRSFGLYACIHKKKAAPRGAAFGFSLMRLSSW